ncbi:hypothetical protein BBR01nite_60660 [Brevibacillus brevis]|nr:hypothetical protein BBR01nite_60660 [Brevibacillus brevis]
MEAAVSIDKFVMEYKDVPLSVYYGLMRGGDDRLSNKRNGVLGRILLRVAYTEREQRLPACILQEF